MKSKKRGKLVFFVVFILILALTYTAFFGVSTYYGDTKEVYLKGAEDIRIGEGRLHKEDILTTY